MNTKADSSNYCQPTQFYSKWTFYGALPLIIWLIIDSIDSCTSGNLIESSYAVDYDAQFYFECKGWLWSTRDNPQFYGEVNSVKKHNYKIWLNDGVY